MCYESSRAGRKSSAPQESPEDNVLRDEVTASMKS